MPSSDKDQSSSADAQCKSSSEAKPKAKPKADPPREPSAPPRKRRRSSTSTNENSKEKPTLEEKRERNARNARKTYYKARYYFDSVRTEAYDLRAENIELRGENQRLEELVQQALVLAHQQDNSTAMASAGMASGMPGMMMAPQQPQIPEPGRNSWGHSVGQLQNINMGANFWPLANPGAASILGVPSMPGDQTQQPTTGPLDGFRISLSNAYGATTGTESTTGSNVQETLQPPQFSADTLAMLNQLSGGNLSMVTGQSLNLAQNMISSQYGSSNQSFPANPQQLSNYNTSDPRLPQDAAMLASLLLNANTGISTGGGIPQINAGNSALAFQHQAAVNRPAAVPFATDRSPAPKASPTTETSKQAGSKPKRDSPREI